MARMTAAPPQPRLLWRAATSVADQAWLSAINLALGLILIRLTTKESYATYAQLYVAGLFAATIAEALITNPLTTLAASYSETRRASMSAHLARLQARLSTATAVLFGAGCAGVAAHLDVPHPWLLGLAFGAYVKTSAVREYRRSLLFLQGDARRVLALDLRYGLAAIAGAGLLIATQWLSIPAVFGVLAAANLLAGERRAVPLSPAAGPDTLSYPQAVAEAWRRGRLGLPGALLAWIISYSYLYLAAGWLGAAATADLNASRLLLMPISLSVVAWSRVARPLMGQLLARGDHAGMRRLLLGSVLGIEALTLAYVAAMWAVLPWLQHHVLGPKYANVAPLILAWGLYFAVYGARWIGTALMMGADRYGFMLCVACVSLAVMLVTVNLAIPRYGTLGAILALTLVECVSLTLVWLAYFLSVRKRASS